MVVFLDYSGYPEFPFPSLLSEDDQRVRDFFLNLKDDEQLALLNSSDSYHTFYDRVVGRMNRQPPA